MSGLNRTRKERSSDNIKIPFEVQTSLIVLRSIRLSYSMDRCSQKKILRNLTIDRFLKIPRMSTDLLLPGENKQIKDFAEYVQILEKDLSWSFIRSEIDRSISQRTASESGRRLSAFLSQSFQDLLNK